MKNLIILIVTTLFVISCKNEVTTTEEQSHDHGKTAEKVEEQKKKPLSPHTETMAMIGDAHIHIDYSSPAVRERIIFGGLVGYDNVWQAGAHNATWIETNKDLIVSGKVLPIGKYGFFIIPSQEDDWTVILNKNWNQHGKDDYSMDEDVMRFKVTPTKEEDITEHLTYEIRKKNEKEGTISLAWEKVRIEFPITIKD